MTPSKNVEALLQMMAAWPERHLVLAGPSQVRNAELASSAQALGLRNLTVLSAVSDSQKAWLYANCGAFFFPSLTEGFGLPPLEAMHFGKPVFLANLTSLPEVGGNAALYWEDFDPARMRAVVEAGLAGWSPDRSRAAVERAASFNWNRAAEQYIQQYLLLLDARFEDGKTACRAGS
jgi:glycosyltransferase involved in cell wall biosynthesis